MKDAPNSVLVFQFFVGLDIFKIKKIEKRIHRNENWVLK